MRTLTSITKYGTNADFGAAWVQTLTLLGKLGGRNRRWLKAPQELPYKEHMEHGMRLILTFRPTTSFLVPLDKCLNFSLDALAGKTKGVRSTTSHRELLLCNLHCSCWSDA